MLDQMTIESTAAAHSAKGEGPARGSATESARLNRILRYFRERLECLTVDVMDLITAINDDDSDAINRLETDIRRLYGWSELADEGTASAQPR